MHTALAAADNCSPCLYHRSHRSMRRHKLTTCSTRGVAECSTPRLFRSLLCPGPMPHATSPCTPRPPKYECVSEALEVPSGHLRSVLKSSQVKATSRQVKSSQRNITSSQVKSISDACSPRGRPDLRQISHGYHPTRAPLPPCDLATEYLRSLATADAPPQCARMHAPCVLGMVVLGRMCRWERPSAGRALPRGVRHVLLCSSSPPSVTD